jgi:hypothetical protein
MSQEEPYLRVRATRALKLSFFFGSYIAPASGATETTGGVRSFQLLGHKWWGTDGERRALSSV